MNSDSESNQRWRFEISEQILSINRDVCGRILEIRGYYRPKVKKWLTSAFGWVGFAGFFGALLLYLTRLYSPWIWLGIAVAAAVIMMIIILLLERHEKRKAAATVDEFNAR